MIHLQAPQTYYDINMMNSCLMAWGDRTHLEVLQIFIKFIFVAAFDITKTLWKF